MGQGVKRAIRLLHVLDSTLCWDQRLAIEQLLTGLDAEHFEQAVLSLGPHNAESARLDRAVEVTPRRCGLDAMSAPALGRAIAEACPDVIHAWGTSAMRTIASADVRRRCLVTSISDPSAAEAHARLVLSEPATANVRVLCATELVRRVLIEHGIAEDSLTLVRPGIDFGDINRAKRSNLRDRLGLAPDAVMLLADQPATRAGGHFTALWSAAVRAMLEPEVRLVLPGQSREAERLRRLANALGQAHVLIAPGDEYRFEDLVSVADCLLLPRTEPGSVAAVAWAMGAGVPILAAATPAVAELLAHDRNAHLLKPDRPKRLAMRFAQAIGNRHDWTTPTDTARAEAYEAFGLRRHLDEVRRAYQAGAERQ